MYSEDLREEAHDNLHRAAVEVFRSRADDVTVRIRGKYDPEYDSLANEIKGFNPAVPEQVRMERVEECLNHYNGHISTQVESSMIDDEELNLPNLTSVKAFLVSGKPFDNLRENLQHLVRPSMNTTIRHVVESEDRNQDTKNSLLSTANSGADSLTGIPKEGPDDIHVQVPND